MLRKVFHVCLSKVEVRHKILPRQLILPQSQENVLFLSTLAAELEHECAEANKDLDAIEMTANIIDRVLIERLSLDRPDLSLVHYLADCFKLLCDEESTLGVRYYFEAHHC